MPRTRPWRSGSTRFKLRAWAHSACRRASKRSPAAPTRCPSPTPLRQRRAVLNRPFPTAGAGHLRPRLLLGRRAQVLAGAGVYTTAVGYAGGVTPNPTYAESAPAAPATPRSCARLRPEQTSYDELLEAFWENHDPTQGMRQGNDVGTQYRTAIYTLQSRSSAGGRGLPRRLPESTRRRGFGAHHHRDRRAPTFYYAEDYHQQYLAKNPNGYCGIGGTGVSCPIGVGVKA